MSLHLYTALKAWRQARQLHKDPTGAPPRVQMPARELPADAVAAVYAAGIACAGQVSEQPNR